METQRIPPQSSRVINATPFFYGWVILIAGTLGIILIGPSQTFTVGIFLDFFISDLGISRSNLALIYGLATLSASFLLPITGRLFDRFGARRMILGTAFGLGLACIGLSQVQGWITVFFGLLALRFMGFGSLQMVSNNMIALWFIRKRGFVMGLAGMSLAASLVIFPALTESLIASFTWRGAWIALGLLVCAVMLPVGWLFFRDKPELYGLRPDGDSALGIDAYTQDGSPHRGDEEVNWTIAEARQTGAFWLFLIALSTITMILAGLVFHQISLFEARGLGRDLGVSIFQTIALFSVIGNLSMGRLLDMLSARLLLACMLIGVAAALLFVQLMTQPAHAFIYGAITGLIAGGFRVMDSVVWAKYFGRQNLGAIRGVTMLGVVGIFGKVLSHPSNGNRKGLF